MDLRLTSLLALVCLTACVDSARKEDAPATGNPVNYLPADAATGWSEIVVTAGFTDTRFSNSGHFAIERNACFVDGNGAVAIEVWNALARAANAVTQAEMGGENDSACFPAATGQYTMDGTVKLKLAAGGERVALEARGSDICSSSKNREAARALLDAVNKALPDAFREDCVTPQ